METIESNLKDRELDDQDSINLSPSNIPSSSQFTDVGNRITSDQYLDINREAFSIPEEELVTKTTVVDEYFEETWSEEEVSDIPVIEQLEYNNPLEEFLADDIQHEEGELNPDEYSDLEEEFPIADDPYILNSRLTQMAVASSSDPNEFFTGQVFPSRQVFKDALARHAILKNFRYKRVDTRLNRIKVVCFNQPCSWRVVARGDMEFTVTKYVQQHECGTVRETADHHACSSTFVANQIVGRFASSDDYKPRSIQREMQSRFGVHISYKKAYTARQKALNRVVGDFDQAYVDLPMYLRELRVRDPDTYVAVLRNGENQFQRCFWAFGACGRVFRSYLRKLIGIDATHTTGKYPGVLLMATAVDGNAKILPVAFGIAEVECGSAWEWFLEHVKTFLAVLPESLSIVSDRHRGIISAVNKVYPSAHHAFCCYHLSCNMVTDTRDRSALGLFWAAARANTTVEYDRLMQNMNEKHKDAYTWLQKMDKKRWANAHFPGRRYTMLTTNCSESLNALFKDTRELPINSIIDNTRRKVAQWFFNRREESSKRSGYLTPYAIKEIDERRAKTRLYSVFPYSQTEMEVQTTGSSYIVDLERRSCICGEFQISGIPCSHAIAVIIYRNMDPYLYCEHYFLSRTWEATYMDRIYPCRSKKFWPNGEKNFRVLPPRSLVQSGRRKKARIESKHTGKVKNKCSRCKQLGHNRRSCRMPPSTTS